METTVAIEQFPIAYSPMRYSFFGIQSAVAGVGYNISKALTTLGSQVNFLTLVGMICWGDKFGSKRKQMACPRLHRRRDAANGPIGDFVRQAG